MKNKKTQYAHVKSKEKELPCHRFMAMSKLMGIVTFIFIAVIIIFCMCEMYRSMDYSAMSQLIVSSFGFASIYAGFYLTMAKLEHIEEEKTRRELEILNLQKQQTNIENIDTVRQELQTLNDMINSLITQNNNSIM